uniref:Hypothetical zinc ABC transporter, ATP binding protein n=1 Tax=uncultured microorganism TaxID=358574 RepID=L8B107_9ZZZZ|nr:hypothetical zinc ABC transporter, ATP binding protein [uncultured microorganism]
MNGPDNSPLLELRDAGVRAPDGRWLIRHVSLSVRRGEIVTLIGPNGGGKTTTIRAALGILPLTEGDVRRAPGLRVGYVPQKLALDPALPMTVARFMRLTCPATEAEVTRALEETGVCARMNAQVAGLSGGELQRVLIARAILRKPDLLVLDEPVQGVDFAGEAALYELIGSIRERLGCGVLLVSHDLHFVMAGTDRVVCINGHVCCSGHPHAVTKTPEYAELFGPAALERLAAYTHHHDHVHAPDGHVCGTEDCGCDDRKEKGE